MKCTGTLWVWQQILICRKYEFWKGLVAIVATYKYPKHPPQTPSPLQSSWEPSLSLSPLTFLTAIIVGRRIPGEALRLDRARLLIGSHCHQRDRAFSRAATAAPRWWPR